MNRLLSVGSVQFFFRCKRYPTVTFFHLHLGRHHVSVGFFKLWPWVEFDFSSGARKVR